MENLVDKFVLVKTRKENIPKRLKIKTEENTCRYFNTDSTRASALRNIHANMPKSTFQAKIGPNI